MVFSEVSQEHQAVDDTLEDSGGIKSNSDKKDLSSLKAPVKLIGFI